MYVYSHSFFCSLNIISMPNDIVHCDCLGNCFHQFPEITRGTRYNHRKDDKILSIQANILAGRQSGPQFHSNPNRNHQQAPYTQARDNHYHVRFHSQNSQRPTSQVQENRNAPATLVPVAEQSPNTIGSNTRSTRVLSARTETALKLIHSEVIARSQLTFAHLATPLVFIHIPADNGIYKHQLQRIPNTGLYKLDSRARINTSFLEQENRLWELLGLAHFLPACAQKDELENRIWHEIDRSSGEKELHWNQQRLHIDIGQPVVNNGMIYLAINLET